MRAARAVRCLVVVVAASAALQAVAQRAAQARFGYLGLGPAQAGQTVQQAEAALGAPLRAAARPGAGAGTSCQLHSTAAQPGVAYVVDRGIVTRMETRDARYRTVSGVRVGDDVNKVRKAYGKRLRVSPHLYFARGLTLAVYSPDRQFALVMESNDSERIVTLRGGMVPAVEYLEGCSA